MLKIICPYCKKENTFQSKSEFPSECSFCWETISQDAQIIEEDDSNEITGLTLIYQINQLRLEVSTDHKTILGRENFGASLFSEIFFNGKPVISRKHCSIEFRGGNFYLLDEESKNGTFYGVNKISCKNSPQVIQDKSIFYIGEEVFMAHINYKQAKQTTVEAVAEIQNKESKIIKVYRCSYCGTETVEKVSECSSCERYNTLIPIYE